MDFIKEERSEMRKRGTSVEEKKLRAEEKGRAVALLPIGVFLILFLGMGIVFGDFYAMPAICGIFDRSSDSVFAEWEVNICRQNEGDFCRDRR
mgnify:CR=1 FL=1